MYKGDVRNNDEMKTKKKLSFRTQSGGALNWPAIMLLDNEEYVGVDMKLEIRRIIGLHLSAIQELTIWRHVQIFASIRNALESRKGLKQSQIEVQGLYPSLRNEVWANSWFKLPKAKLQWKCLIDLHWPSHLLMGFKSSLESNLEVKYSVFNEARIQ
jgi:hypothetical protein